MEEKRMTSGEIAKKAGVSQKAIRLYDEKGLLKPSDYSEGNYRLYDQEALLILEKIIALKQVGFTLEEIRENLIVENNIGIRESLNRQLEIMEKKKQEIERTINCIKGMLIRTDGEPDWNHVAEIARTIQKDQEADEGHFYALKYTAEDKDWYERIYETLYIKENERILDLGCGFGMLWRKNWRAVPAGVTMDGVDLSGSHADDFQNYVVKNRAELSGGTQMTLYFQNVEEDGIWEKLQQKPKYTLVIAHYLLDFIENRELLLERIVDILEVGGMLSCNDVETETEHVFWKNILEKAGVSTGFLDAKIAGTIRENDEFRAFLEKEFDTVEVVTLSSNFRYENSEEAFERLCRQYPENKKYLIERKPIIVSFLDTVLDDMGEIMVEHDAVFWQCYK